MSAPRTNRGRKVPDRECSVEFDAKPLIKVASQARPTLRPLPHTFLAEEDK